MYFDLHKIDFSIYSEITLLEILGSPKGRLGSLVIQFQFENNMRGVNRIRET